MTLMNFAVEVIAAQAVAAMNSADATNADQDSVVSEVSVASSHPTVALANAAASLPATVDSDSET